MVRGDGLAVHCARLPRLARLLDRRQRLRPQAARLVGQARRGRLALRACGAFNALGARGRSRARPALSAQPAAFGGRVLARRAECDLPRGCAIDALPRQPAADQRSRALGGAAAGLPHDRPPRRLAARHPRNRRERGTKSLFDRYSYHYGAFGWGDPAARTRIPANGAARGRIWRRPSMSRIGRAATATPSTPRFFRPRADARLYLARQAARLARAEIGSRPRRLREGGDRGGGRCAQFASRELQSGAPGRALVLAHSVFWQYLTDATKGDIRAAIAEAAARATSVLRSHGCAWRRRPTSGAARCCACRSGREGLSTRRSPWWISTAGGSMALRRVEGAMINKPDASSLVFPFPMPPGPGEAIEVAPGVLWTADSASPSVSTM